MHTAHLFKMFSVLHLQQHNMMWAATEQYAFFFLPSNLSRIWNTSCLAREKIGFTAFSSVPCCPSAQIYFATCHYFHHWLSLLLHPIILHNIMFTDKQGKNASCPDSKTYITNNIIASSVVRRKNTTKICK